MNKFEFFSFVPLNLFSFIFLFDHVFGSKLRTLGNSEKLAENSPGIRKEGTMKRKEIAWFFLVRIYLDVRIRKTRGASRFVRFKEQRMGRRGNGYGSSTINSPPTLFRIRFAARFRFFDQRLAEIPSKDNGKRGTRDEIRTENNVFLFLFRKKNFQNQITVSLICNHFDRIIFVLILFRATLSFLRFILIKVDLFNRT